MASPGSASKAKTERTKKFSKKENDKGTVDFIQEVLEPDFTQFVVADFVTEYESDDFKTGKIFRGTTKWKSPSGGKKASEMTFSHYETWNSVEDPIDAFPGDEAYSDDRLDETRIIYSRGEQEVRRNLESKKCRFGSGYPVLTTEHCSEIQALVGAQLLTKCKGE